MMNPNGDHSWPMQSVLQTTERPEQLLQELESFGQSVHYLIDCVPKNLIAKETALGLSPAWVLGHLALLLNNGIDNFGGTTSEEFSDDFATLFRPGGDGSDVDMTPDSLIGLFDLQMSEVCRLLRCATRSQLSERQLCDDFGLEKILPYESLGGYGAAAIRYAGMYTIELAMLCEELS